MESLGPGAHNQRQIDLAREELTAMLSEAPDLALRIARAMTALNTLERSLGDDGVATSVRRQRGPKQARTVEGYRIEITPNGPVLAEFRSTDAEPFRCPKSIAEVTATELQKLRQAKFIDLFEAIQASVGQRVPDYHIRTALRFMKHAGIVRHEKARFSSANKGSLRKALLAAWKDLEAES